MGRQTIFSKNQIVRLNNISIRKLNLYLGFTHAKRAKPIRLVLTLRPPVSLTQSLIHAQYSTYQLMAHTVWSPPTSLHALHGCSLPRGERPEGGCTSRSVRNLVRAYWGIRGDTTVFDKLTHPLGNLISFSLLALCCFETVVTSTSTPNELCLVVFAVSSKLLTTIFGCLWMLLQRRRVLFFNILSR